MFLLDTSLISVLLPWMTASPLRLLYADVLGQAPHTAALQTEAEVWQGVGDAGWGEPRRRKVGELFARVLVIPPDRMTGLLWGEMRASSKAQGCLLSATDAWIAATAIQYNLTLATHDEDLRRVTFPGLRVLCRAPA